MRQRHLIALICVCFFAVPSLWADDAERFFKRNDRVVFLGDSNTYAGVWIEWFDAWQRKAHPDWKLDVLNLGLSSETTTGLSEPTHPFPRPDVRERLGRVLERTKPNVIVFCYGMNDAIYHPFSEARFQVFQKCSLEAVRKIKAAGTKVIWLTPPPFDPKPLRAKGNLRPAGGDQYSWQFVSEDYDATIAKYAKWVVEQKAEVDLMVDLHTPLAKELLKRRGLDSDFAFTSDGVHFTDQGHLFVAQLFIRALGEEAKLDYNADTMKRVRQRLHVLRDAYLSEIGHLRPGVAVGKPLADAVAESIKIEAELRSDNKSKPVALFDLDRFDAWSTPDGKTVPASWEVKDGLIHLSKGSTRGGNIVTVQEFADFTLEFEFKIATKGNSGVKYRVQRYGQRYLGFEYQVQDDVGIQSRSPKNQTGSIYDLYGPDKSVTPNPAGEWNLARVEANGNRIEHYLNGKIIVSATLGDDDWKTRLAASKFAETDGFGEKPRGRIMLTDHGSEVWYRNFVLVEH